MPSWRPRDERDDDPSARQPPARRVRPEPTLAERMERAGVTKDGELD